MTMFKISEVDSVYGDIIVILYLCVPDFRTFCIRFVQLTRSYCIFAVVPKGIVSVYVHV